MKATLLRQPKREWREREVFFVLISLKQWTCVILLNWYFFSISSIKKLNGLINFLCRSIRKEKKRSKVSKRAAGQAIASVKNFVLATHVRPDGDALGSTFGLAHILKMMGKEVLCYLEQPVADVYNFLTPHVPIETDFPSVAAFVEKCGVDIMGIALDCGDLGRLGEKGRELNNIHPFLVIDHHQGNKGFGDLHWVEPHRSSTGEMVYDLAEELGVADQLSREAAECLYTAIVTDTGSFRYDSTTEHTFAVAGKLIDRGVTPASVCQKLFDNASFGSLQLTQTVLATLQAPINQITSQWNFIRAQHIK
ncbi:MAG: hypothetical protein D3922_11220 [Candidatus Electrothrix sp. AR1]|nr:hypothetical protein [Candidatus Electrothrix sp. AR1]